MKRRPALSGRGFRISGGVILYGKTFARPWYKPPPPMEFCDAVASPRSGTQRPNIILVAQSKGGKECGAASGVSRAVAIALAFLASRLAKEDARQALLREWTMCGRFVAG